MVLARGPRCENLQKSVTKCEKVQRFCSNESQSRPRMQYNAAKKFLDGGADWHS